mgnify:CR=1 FL=1
MTARQRAKRIAYWRGLAITLLVVALFCLLLAATDAIQQI